MERTLRKLSAILLVTVLVAGVFPLVAGSAGRPRRVIVTFERGEAAASRAALQGAGASRVKDLPAASASVMMVPPGLSDKDVLKTRGVVAVEEDIVIRALAPKKPAPTPSQTLPWGVDRVEADLVWPQTTGDPVKVAIVDTGIDTAHPDLIGNLKGGYSAVGYTSKYTDDNGHGTHVAGTVAAVNNTVGVVGVAHKADLYAVKVLDRNGSGYLSDIVEGLDWAIANKMHVVNMSLGTSAYSATFDAACQRTLSAGITIVAAAGNEGPYANTVGYPAKFSGVIAVSAIDSASKVASFSSRGPEVDVAAPGVGIYSTYKGKTYATLNGTSMASPHVAGIAALVLTTPVGSDDLDADGAWDPAEVTQRITRTAVDLGTAGFDSEYGWGMARADLAVAAR